MDSGRRYPHSFPFGNEDYPFYNPTEYYVPEECIICHSFHDLQFCHVFLEMTVKKREEALKRHNICGNCLELNHPSYDCYVSCFLCGGWHHTLLHKTTDTDVKQRKARKPAHKFLQPPPGGEERLAYLAKKRKIHRYLCGRTYTGFFERALVPKKPRTHPLAKRPQVARKRIVRVAAMSAIVEIQELQ